MLGCDLAVGEVAQDRGGIAQGRIAMAAAARLLVADDVAGADGMQAAPGMGPGRMGGGITGSDQGVSGRNSSSELLTG